MQNPSVQLCGKSQEGKMWFFLVEIPFLSKCVRVIIINKCQLLPELDERAWRKCGGNLNPSVYRYLAYLRRHRRYHQTTTQSFRKDLSKHSRLHRRFQLRRRGRKLVNASKLRCRSPIGLWAEAV